jgi:hypothetical protein
MGALLLACGLLPAEASETMCVGPAFPGPIVRDYRKVLIDCRAGRCPPAYVAADAPFDDLLYGTGTVRVSAMRDLVSKGKVRGFLVDVQNAIRSKRYRQGFAAYYWEFVSADSMTHVLDFQYGADALHVQELLRQASIAPVTDAQRSSLSQLCRVHGSSKQLRLYAALADLERNDVDGAIWSLLTVPYLGEGAPDRHYFALDSAAIGQALDIDSSATLRILTSLRADVAKRLNSPEFVRSARPRRTTGRSL